MDKNNTVRSYQHEYTVFIILQVTPTGFAFVADILIR